MRVKKILEKLEEIRKMKGLSQNKFSTEELQIPATTYSRYLRGNTMPGGARLEEFSEYIKENEPHNLGEIPNTGSKIIRNQEGETLLLDDEGHCAKIASLPDAYKKIEEILQEENLEVPK